MYFPDTVDGNLIETYVGMISYDLLCYDTQGFDRYLRSIEDCFEKLKKLNVTD